MDNLAFEDMIDEIELLKKQLNGQVVIESFNLITIENNSFDNDLFNHNEKKEELQTAWNMFLEDCNILHENDIKTVYELNITPDIFDYGYEITVMIK